MMVNGLHLTAEQKAKAVVLADKCCSKIDKSVPKKGWLALQMVECVQRAILMATDYKVLICFAPQHGVNCFKDNYSRLVMNVANIFLSVR